MNDLVPSHVERVSVFAFSNRERREDWEEGGERERGLVDKGGKNLICDSKFPKVIYQFLLGNNVSFFGLNLATVHYTVFQSLNQVDFVTDFL